MSNGLVNGFTAHRDDKLIAVSASFVGAQEAAAEQITISGKSSAFQIRTASSLVVRGIGASSMRVWNYDWDIREWVEHVR